MTHFQSGCLICGEELIYHATTASTTCLFCGKTFQTSVTCSSGHYICDQCHSASAKEVIRSYCLASSERDPLTMSQQLMRHPALKMHGPEHHYLVPAVLLTAYCNTIPDPPSLSALLEKAWKRSDAVPGGVCGTHGCCGAGVGAGIFISLITEATPLTVKSWSLGNRMTAQALLKIADNGGPRCCKRDTFLAIQCAIQFLQETFQVQLETPAHLQCDFFSHNRQCLKSQCLFFHKK